MKYPAYSSGEESVTGSRGMLVLLKLSLVIPASVVSTGLNKTLLLLFVGIAFLCPSYRPGFHCFSHYVSGEQKTVPASKTLMPTIT